MALALSHTKDEPTVYLRLPDGRIGSVTVAWTEGTKTRVSYEFPPDVVIQRRLEWLESPREELVPSVGLTKAPPRPIAWMAGDRCQYQRDGQQREGVIRVLGHNHGNHGIQEVGGVFTWSVETENLRPLPAPEPRGLDR